MVEWVDTAYGAERAGSARLASAPHTLAPAQTQPLKQADDTGAVLFDFCALRASLLLDFREPELSAMHRLRFPVGPRVAGASGLLAATGLIAPQLALIAACWAGLVTFALLVAWRLALMVVATAPGFARPPDGRDVTDIDLPVYTIFIPLFRESAALPALAKALHMIDWPADRLDILILMEAGDLETREAVQTVSWPEGTTGLVLPPGAPQTKPRALNYGLQYARGEFACIYDVEDRPHPRQLKAAFAAFRDGGESLGCVQAPLAAFNHRQTWLSCQWALEYAVQFGLLLPALARLRLPILLGGTSNHFRTALLRRMNGWDAWNVTEDADLGVRLARKGYRSTVIALPTYEEAPETLAIWTAQRSRWLKGFWQSWLVVMRRPQGAIAQIGWAGFAALQFMLLGTCLAALLHGPILLLTGLALAVRQADLFGPGLWLMGIGYGTNAIAVLIAPGPRGMHRLAAALTLPLYWPLQSLAAVRALYGWLRAPHFWAKTPHGLTAHPG